MSFYDKSMIFWEDGQSTKYLRSDCWSSMNRFLCRLCRNLQKEAERCNSVYPQIIKWKLLLEMPCPWKGTLQSKIVIFSYQSPMTLFTTFQHLHWLPAFKLCLGVWCLVFEQLIKDISCHSKLLLPSRLCAYLSSTQHLVRWYSPLLLIFFFYIFFLI